jgi:hypothetical protein
MEEVQEKVLAVLPMAEDMEVFQALPPMCRKESIYIGSFENLKL